MSRAKKRQAFLQPANRLPDSCRKPVPGPLPYGTEGSFPLLLQDANNGCVLYIGSTGDVMVDTVAGSTATRKVLFTSVPVGFFPIQVTNVYEEGTTASKIVAIW